MILTAAWLLYLEDVLRATRTEFLPTDMKTPLGFNPYGLR
jgi:hypothetical protein